jgi:hypothetical protein
MLDVAMPPGLDLLEAVGVPVGAGGDALADRMEASRWRIELPGVASDTLRAAWERVVAAEVVEVERLTKNGMRTIDARAAIVTGWVEDDPDGSPSSTTPGPCGILVVVVRQLTPAVRPDDVLSALRVVAALEPPVPAKATRMAQGRLDDGGGLSDPLAPDRAARASACG